MQRALFILLSLFSFNQLFGQAVFQGNPINIRSTELDQRFSGYQLIELDADAISRYARENAQGATVQLQLSRSTTWDLEIKAVDIRQAGYQLVVQTEEGRQLQAPSPNKTYRGSSLGSQPGPVRLTLDNNFIYGRVSSEGTTFYIEPAWMQDATIEEGVYLLYEETAPISQGYTCGTDEAHEHEYKENPPTAPEAARMMNCLQLPVALAADFSMFDIYGSVANTENFMVGVLNNVQSNYDNEFNDEIDFEVAGFFISTCSSCDPWTSSTNAGTLLNSFTSWGNNGGFGFSYSLASLWTNRNLNGSTIGVAWVGGLCSNLRYNILQRFSTNASLLRVLQAHEFGHNFNANHDAPGSPFIMAPSVNTSTQWSTASQNSINSFISLNSGQPGCFFPCAAALPPDANIVAPATHVCPGSIVPFIDGSTNDPTSWDWEFQGGLPPTSSQQNPNVLYPDEGVFTVVLTVENSIGVDVDVLATDITVDQNGTKYLLYETFENGLGSWTAINPDNSVTWETKQVGGTQYGSRAAFMDNFSYNAIGQADALLSPTLSFAGESGIAFQMDYAYRRYNAQSSDQMRISISTDGGNSFDELFFGQETGGGNFATSPDLTSSFTPTSQSHWCYAGYGPGCITLDLSAYSGEDNVRIKIDNINDFGNNLYIDNIRISSNCQPPEPPISSFTSDVTTGCAPLTVQYQDLSFGTVENWEWSFPGGVPSTSFEQNPTVTYNMPGTYEASLTVYNAAGADEASLPAYINVLGPPTPDFIYEVDGLTVNFTDLSIDASSISWAFGDGTTSSEPAPEHTYDAAGEYDVILYANNSCGTDSLVQTITLADPISAGFTADTLQGCPGLTVMYTDTTLGDVVSWYWEFEGGMPATDTVQNPIVDYDTSGIFSTTLIVTTDNGSSDTLLQNNYIHIDSLPEAGFIIEDSLGLTTVNFIDNSLHADSLYWYFGDGDTSTLSNPTHDYGEDGAYTITLIAFSECGSDTAIQTVSIVTPPTAGFSQDTTSGCVPFTITLQDTSSSNTDSLLWLAPGAMPDSSVEATTSFTYDTAGNYTIVLIAMNEAGSDTANINLTVNTGPQAGFSFDYTIGETTVSFSNQSTNASSYSWNFGQGDTSSEENPSFDFSADGIYTATLIATNDCGSDTSSQNIEIITPPSAAFSLADTEGCTPFTVTPQENASANTDEWSWVAPGATPSSSNSPDPSFTYDTPGSYTITLITSNEAGSDTAAVDISVGQGPQAGFSFDYTIGETTVSFSNQSTNADSYSWEFGQNGSSSEENPDFDFGTDGIYTATLIATNDCGSDTSSQNIEIITPPSAAFSLADTEGCTPFTVTPQENASANTDEWSWVAPGATPSSSNSPDPSFTYDTPGSYTITLITSNEAGSDTAAVDISVGQGPQAGFSFDYTIGETTVSFSNQSTNADSYSWEFGQNGFSSEENPDFDFGTDGIYTATLIATNDCGSDTTSQNIEIITPPSAAFSLADTEGCTPFTVTPQENASANTDEWSWLAPGATPDASDSPDPSFTYDTPGSYTITLITSNEAGSDTAAVDISVGQGPQAGFSFDYSIGETTVSFSNQSTNADSYSWNFGQNSSSSEENPDFDFGTDGIYTTTLIATNDCGSDTTSQNIEIITPPTADFSLADTEGCTPFTVTPQENASDNTDEWSWLAPSATPSSSNSPDPSFTYDTPGSYTITLITSNEAGSDTAAVDISVGQGPQAGFGFDYTIGETTVSFSNQSTNADSYSWNFGQNGSSSEENPDFDFGTDGIYTTTLIATNDCGSDTSSQNIEIITPPSAAFSLADTEGCAPFTVTPQENASANTDEWSWLAPGATPSSSNSPDPSFTYDTPGSYTISLITSNEAGSDTASVDVTALGLPATAYEFQVNGNTVSFQNNSLGANTYEWDFGDGNTSSEIAPQYSYGAIGEYIVQLTAENDCGSTSFIDTVIISQTAPLAGFTVENSTGCAPLQVSFINTSQGAESYEWTFTGGTPSSSTEENPVVTYEVPGIYSVTLLATNSSGSGALTQMNIVVAKSAPVSSFIYFSDINTISFFNNSQGADEYLWLFGDGASSNAENPVHTYENNGTYEAMLISTNECGSDTSTQIIELVGSVPVPDIVVQDSTSGCIPLSVTYFAEIEGGEADIYEWSFEGGTPSISTATNPTVVYQQAGTFSVELTTSNASGSASDTEADLITVESLPAVNFTFQPLSTFEISFTSDVSGSGPLSYEWDFGDGNISTETNPIHTYETEGAYEVVLKVSNKCGEDSISQTVNILLGSTVDESWLHQLFIYPNPNRGQFTLEIEAESSSTISARLLNVVGQSVHRVERAFYTGYWRHTFNERSLPTGVYILEISTGSEKAYRRVVVE